MAIDKYREIRNAISHGTDGPITNFVLISRAIDLATSGNYSDGKWPDSDMLANALYEELTDRGMLTDGSIETPGS